MFLLNVGWTWSLATDVEEVRGAVFLAANNPHLRFTRNAGPDLDRLLIDPQLYLAGLDRGTCGKACGRLATHPWFCVPDLPAYNSGTLGVREWQKQVEAIAAAQWPGKAPVGDQIPESSRAAIQCQLNFGCTHVILPAPLVEEREDEGATLGTWLDAGIDAADELEVGQPLLATVALSEATLNEEAFSAGGFLDAIVDHVTARQGVAGVYIVIAQAGPSQHPFNTRPLVLRSYLHLSMAFRAAGVQTVLVNFADTFGLVCAGVGATDFASGSSQTQRRLSLAAFRDEGGGIALPHFYSHRVIGEFTTEGDLGLIVRGGAFRRVLDETQASQDLLEALSSGGSAAAVPAWAESQNNLTAASRHFVARLALEGQRYRRHPQKRRENLVRDWLEEAEGSVLYLRQRLKVPVIGRVASAANWLDLLDKAIT